MDFQKMHPHLSLPSRDIYCSTDFKQRSSFSLHSTSRTKQADRVMRAIKALRRSIKGEKEGKPQHVSIAPKSALAIVPPKKVRHSAMQCTRFAKPTAQTSNLGHHGEGLGEYLHRCAVRTH